MDFNDSLKPSLKSNDGGSKSTVHSGGVLSWEATITVLNNIENASFKKNYNFNMIPCSSPSSIPTGDPLILLVIPSSSSISPSDFLVLLIADI